MRGPGLEIRDWYGFGCRIRDKVGLRVRRKRLEVRVQLVRLKS